MSKVTLAEVAAEVPPRQPIAINIVSWEEGQRLADEADKRDAEAQPEIKTDAEGKRRMDMVRERIRANNLAALRLRDIEQDNPAWLEWLDTNEFNDDGDIYALIETVGYQQWLHRHDEFDATDTGPWQTRWYQPLPTEAGAPELQMIWREFGAGMLTLCDDAERDDFTVLMQSKLSEPDWDRGTYDAYKHARSKDD